MVVVNIRLVWDPHGCLVIARLPGHTASVQEILIDDSRNQIMTLSTDKFIRIWDCRNFRCIQTFQDSQPHRPEDRITAMAWDARHSSLLTGTNRLQVWPVRMFSKRVDLTHEAPLCTALYNRSFSQVVTSDETAVVCSWNIQTGQQVINHFRTVTFVPSL
jgi:WD40 repeat protein